MEKDADGAAEMRRRMARVDRHQKLTLAAGLVALVAAVALLGALGGGREDVSPNEEVAAAGGDGSALEETPDGLYCGATVPGDGDFGGRQAAAARCGALTDCGASARPCSLQEVQRSTDAGTRVPAGRVARGEGGPADATVVEGCLGWTSAASEDRSDVWLGDEGPGTAACHESLPMLCCE